jgi:hypothetical protein
MSYPSSALLIFAELSNNKMGKFLCGSPHEVGRVVLSPLLRAGFRIFI